MSPPFDVIVPDGEDPGSVYRALLIEMAEYYEDALAARTAERDFHEAQSFAYIDQIAQLSQKRTSIVTRAARRVRRILRRPIT